MRCLKGSFPIPETVRLYVLTETFQNVTFHICVFNPSAVIFVYGVRKKSSIFSHINNYPSTIY